MMIEENKNNNVECSDGKHRYQWWMPWEFGVEPCWRCVDCKHILKDKEEIEKLERDPDSTYWKVWYFAEFLHECYPLIKLSNSDMMDDLCMYVTKRCHHKKKFGLNAVMMYLGEYFTLSREEKKNNLDEAMKFFVTEDGKQFCERG